MKAKLWALYLLLLALWAVTARATSFEMMRIEKLIGGVAGDHTRKPFSCKCAPTG